MNEEKVTMADFMDEIEKSMSAVRPGDIVTAKVVSVSSDEVIVDIGSGMDGIIKKDDFGRLVEESLEKSVEAGDEFEVFVLKLDDGSGSAVLSKSRADALTAMDRLSEACEEKRAVQLKIKEAVKGGVVGLFDGVRVFIPLSQLSYGSRVDADDYVGSTIEVEIIEIDEASKKVVASRKAIEEKEMKRNRDGLLSNLSIGQRIDGKVTNVVDYGAFVDIGGAEGLIHISELSWKRVLKASDVVSEGDRVSVIVADIDKEKGKISLKLAGKNDGNPWNDVEENLKVGGIYKGTVTKIKPFGAFVEVEAGIEGLVHISNICEERIATPSERLKVGDEVNVKIISIDADSKRIGMSIKDAADEENDFEYEDYLDDSDDAGSTLGDLFADKLSKLKL